MVTLHKAESQTLFRCGLLTAKTAFYIAQGDASTVHSHKGNTAACVLFSENPPECAVNYTIFLNFIPSGAPPNLAS